MKYLPVLLTGVFSIIVFFVPIWIIIFKNGDNNWAWLYVFDIFLWISFHDQFETALRCELNEVNKGGRNEA